MTTLNVRDANTGNLLEVDIDNPSGDLYVLDQNTGEFLLLDLASPTGVIRGIVLVGNADSIAPTVAITLSSYAMKIGETAVVTFTFSEEVLGFTVADIT